MCIAIFLPPKLIIPDDHLHQSWIANSDGAGFAYAANGKVMVQKGFMLYKEFLAAFSASRDKHKLSPFIIHFRIRSQGDRSEDNTHPFNIPGGALIHNGTIDGTGSEYLKGPSDTKLFSEKFGASLTFPIVSGNKKEFEEALDYNKVVMLYDDGKHVILNEGKGYWVDDVWYSNRSFQNYAKKPTTPNNPLSQVDNLNDHWNYANGMYGGD